MERRPSSEVVGRRFVNGYTYTNAAGQGGRKGAGEWKGRGGGAMKGRMDGDRRFVHMAKWCRERGFFVLYLVLARERK